MYIRLKKSVFHLLTAGFGWVWSSKESPKGVVLSEIRRETAGKTQRAGIIFHLIQGFPNWWASSHLRARGFSMWARNFEKYSKF